MEKQGESKKNIEKHEKRGRIKEKHRKTLGNKEIVEKHEKTGRIRKT